MHVGLLQLINSSIRIELSRYGHTHSRFLPLRTNRGQFSNSDVRNECHSSSAPKGITIYKIKKSPLYIF